MYCETPEGKAEFESEQLITLQELLNSSDESEQSSTSLLPPQQLLQVSHFNNV